MIITSTESRIASQLGLNTGANVTLESSSGAVSEARNQIASSFAAENHIETQNLSWVGIQDSISHGLSNIAFVQLSDEVLAQLETHLIDLKTELEGGADVQKLALIESKISTLVGENQVLQTETISIMANEADLTQDISLTSIKDYASYLSLDGLDIPDEMLFIEVNMQDVLNAHHSPDGCPLCQAAAADALNIVNAEAAPTSTTTELSSSTVSSTGTNTVDSLLSGSKWDVSGGGPVTWSMYNGAVPFDASHYLYNETFDNSAASMMAFESDIQSAFALWDKVSDLEYLQVTETAGSPNQVGEIRVAYTSEAKPGSAAWAYYPSSNPVGGDAWFDSGQTSNQSFTVGGYGFYTALHEFGHSIGLSHPFGGSSSGDTLPFTTDNRRQTVMSYNQSKLDRNLLPSSINITWNSGSYSWSMQYANVNAVTPMVYDIAAAEYLYGISTDAEVGNTNHSANISGFSTIVDSSGVDTLDASLESTASIISLTPGSFSSIGTTTRDALADALVADAVSQVSDQGGTLSAGEQSNIKQSILNSFAANDANAIYGDAIYTGQDNLAIAYSSVIENAKGGSGNDTIQGAHNVDNAIMGGGGDDNIDGLGGTDTAVYSGVKDNYTITHNPNGTITVTDNVGTEGTDTLTSIEAIEFSDVTYDTSSQSTTPTVTSALVSGTPATGVTAGPPTTTTTPSGTTAAPHGYAALSSSDIKTTSGAAAALEVVDAALATVGQERAKFGAVANRLEYASANLLSRIEQQQSAKSRILDADYAVETTKMIKEQIRQQVATVMLGQANMAPQMVTQLLK